MSDAYPTGKYAYETEVLQRELIAGGYLPSHNSRNEPSDDGYFGPATRRALQARELDLAEMPAPAKPWWDSRRGKGMAKLAAGTIVGAAGLFWAGAQDIDAAKAVEIIYDAGPQIDAALAIGRQLLELAGMLLAALGFGQTLVGAWGAKGPIDPTLVARVGTHELRIPGPGPQRVREPRRPAAARAVPTNNNHEPGGYWGRPRGPFSPE